MNHAALSRIGFRQLADSGHSVFKQSEGLPRYLNASRASSSQSWLNCAVCHAREDPHRGQFGLNCTECHETERWSIAAFSTSFATLPGLCSVPLRPAVPSNSALPSVHRSYWQAER